MVGHLKIGSFENENMNVGIFENRNGEYRICENKEHNYVHQTKYFEIETHE